MISEEAINHKVLFGLVVINSLFLTVLILFVAIIVRSNSKFNQNLQIEILSVKTKLDTIECKLKSLEFSPEQIENEKNQSKKAVSLKAVGSDKTDQGIHLGGSLEPRKSQDLCGKPSELDNKNFSIPTPPPPPSRTDLSPIRQAPKNNKYKGINDKVVTDKPKLIAQATNKVNTTDLMAEIRKGVKLKKVEVGSDNRNSHAQNQSIGNDIFSIIQEAIEDRRESLESDSDHESDGQGSDWDETETSTVLSDKSNTHKLNVKEFTKTQTPQKPEHLKGKTLKSKENNKSLHAIQNRLHSATVESGYACDNSRVVQTLRI